MERLYYCLELKPQSSSKIKLTIKSDGRIILDTKSICLDIAYTILHASIMWNKEKFSFKVKNWMV